MRRLLFRASLIGFVFVGACLAADPAGDAGAPRPMPRAPDMRALIAEFASDSESVRDFYTISRSPAHLARMDALHAAWLARLDALNFDALDTDGRIDWLLLTNELRHADQQRAAMRAKLAETAPLLPFADEIAALEEARWRLAPVDAQATATQLDALAKQIKAIKERVEKGKAADAPQTPAAGSPHPWEPLPALPVPKQNHDHSPWQYHSDLVWWFQSNQREDGTWPMDGSTTQPSLDVTATALPLLALIGCGIVPGQRDSATSNVLRGLRQLITAQQADGSFGEGVSRASPYGNAVATLALVDAWALTHHSVLRWPAELALRHLVAMRSSDKLWRASADSRSKAPLLDEDLWITGWAVIVLGLAHDSGLAVDATALKDALAHLDELTDPATGITDDRDFELQPQAADEPTGPGDSARLMTSISLLARLLDRSSLDKPSTWKLIHRQATFIAEQPPAADAAASKRCAAHDWLFGSMALWFAGLLQDADAGDAWKAWESALKSSVLAGQRRDDEQAGSWDPDADAWCTRAGRACRTAVGAMTSQVFYRFDSVLCWHLAKGSAPLFPVAPAAADTPRADAPLADAPLATTPVVAQRAARELDALRRALETWFAHYDEFSPGFSWWTRKPYDATVGALNDYAKFLREDIAGLKGKDEDPLVGDPIGREALVDDLAAEMIDYSPEELLAIGEREFAWCEAQMKLASAEMGFGDDWKAALAAVKADHVAPGEQDRLVTEQSKEAIAFLDAHDLVTVPELCRETWRVRMIGADTQRTLPYAAYGGQDMLVAYPTRDMDTDTKLMTMRGNNVHFSRIVVPHELIPGHHLQGYLAARSNTQRGMFGTPFYGEGWALYWEMRLWELGWAQSPADRIGMLFWRMHRAARIIVSLKFHLGEMQPQEMIDFLVDRVGHEKAGATSEVRRYIAGNYGPLYQCAYMIGGLQLRALHDELVGSAGARDELDGRAGAPNERGAAGAARTQGAVNAATGAAWTEREFHDAVLAQNSMPVALVRAALRVGSEVPPLTRDGVPAWRFAGDP